VSRLCAFALTKSQDVTSWTHGHCDSEPAVTFPIAKYRWATGVTATKLYLHVYSWCFRTQIQWRIQKFGIGDGRVGGGIFLKILSKNGAFWCKIFSCSKMHPVLESATAQTHAVMLVLGLDFRGLVWATNSRPKY